MANEDKVWSPTKQEYVPVRKSPRSRLEKAETKTEAPREETYGRGRMSPRRSGGYGAARRSGGYGVRRSGSRVSPRRSGGYSYGQGATRRSSGRRSYTRSWRGTYYNVCNNWQSFLRIKRAQTADPQERLMATSIYSPEYRQRLRDGTLESYLRENIDRYGIPECEAAVGIDASQDDYTGRTVVPRGVSERFTGY